MKSVLCPLAAVACLATVAPAPADEHPQVVLVSFDGANDVALWKRSMALAEATGARFTYFLSCVYLLAPEQRSIYKGPLHRTGRSNVGFGASKADVTARLTAIWKAHNKGHEIASHGCGHFDGKDWTAGQWSAEFAAFDTILRDAWTLNGGETPAGWRHMASMVTGFRAPYLSAGPALDAALADSGFDYDASSVSRGPAEPTLKDGLVRFALPLVPEGPRQRPIIAMDYNLYVRHSAGLERPSESAAFEERAYAAFRQAFDAEHAGRRRPLEIGLHFRLMNDGAYWRAMERLVREVCVRDDVSCMTYRDYAASVSGEHTSDTDGRPAQ